MLIIDSSNDPQNAAQKPVTAKPGTILATSKNISALITKVNKPKVRMLIGKVKIINTGLIKIFTRPIASADHMAAANPEKLIPGTTQATKSSARAKNIHLISIKIILYLLSFLDYKYKVTTSILHQTRVVII